MFALDTAAVDPAGLSIGNVIELLVVAGLFTAIAETARWFFGGRGRQRVDNAKIVQGMALDLLRPLHEELDEANRSAATLRTQMRDIETEMESILGWAIVARSLLDSHAITYPAPPEPVLRRKV